MQPEEAAVGAGEADDALAPPLAAGDNLILAPGTSMAPALGHARVYTSAPSAEAGGKLMLTFKDYPTGPSFTFARLRELVAEDFDTFLLSIHLTNEEGAAYPPDQEVSPADLICTSAALPLDEWHDTIWLLVEVLLGSFAAVPASLLELPLDAVLFHRLRVLLTERTRPTLIPLVAHMWRRGGAAAFVHSGYYLCVAGFVRELLSRAFTVPLYASLPLHSLVFMLINAPALYQIGRFPAPGTSILDSFYDLPPLKTSLSLYRRMPSLLPLILARDWLAAASVKLAPHALRHVLPARHVSFANHMVRAILVHPIKMIERRMMLGDSPIGITDAAREVFTLPTLLFVDNICANIALRVIVFQMQPFVRSLLNRRMGALVRRMDDQSALRRLAVETVVVVSAPLLLSPVYLWWRRK